MDRKRQRKSVNYVEITTSSDDEGEEGVIDAVNLWKEDITNDMHIRVINKEIFNINPSYDIISCITDTMWNQNIDFDNLPIGNDVKTLVHGIKEVHDANNRSYETYVDTYFNSFLQVLGFNSYPYSVRLHHKYVTRINKDSLKITAKPDFTVTSIKSDKLVIIEDKTMNNARYTNNWKEDQVLGELFVIAHNQEIRDTTSIYAVRVIGTLFTFYKAIVTPEYIKETLNGYPIKHYMYVERYPDPGIDIYKFNALDICKSEDRKVIIEYLNRIKSEF